MTAISARRVHRRLALVAALVLLAWGGSGILHPVITMIGPATLHLHGEHGQLTALQLAGARPIAEILAAGDVREPRMIQVVSAAPAAEPLLQVSETADVPRRYFGLHDGRELPDHDRDYAVHLARHYLGAADLPIRTVTLQTAFDSRYPPVNRLLPVWRVEFSHPDAVTAWIHTENGVLALASDRTRERLQRLFAAVHTWDWTPAGLEWARVAAMSLLVLTLITTGLFGLWLRLRGGPRIPIPRRRTGTGSARTWHRRLGWLFGVPILLLASSGLFHLLHQAADPPGLRLTAGPPMDVGGARYPLFEHWPELAAELDIERVSLVAVPGGGLLYRLGLRRDRGHDHGHDHDHDPATPAAGAALRNATALRNARFDGIPQTGPAVYLDAATGAPWPDGDRELALRLATQFTARPRDAVTNVEQVTRFGPRYDFRNKRLPVWRVDYGPPRDASYFIDTTTGTLVDLQDRPARWEALSFSFLHKWNFLRFTGRTAQNTIMIGVVALALLTLAGLGLQMRRRRVRPAPPALRAGTAAPPGAADQPPGGAGG